MYYLFYNSLLSEEVYIVTTIGRKYCFYSTAKILPSLRICSLKIGKTTGVLDLFVSNVKYANMEGFHRDSQIWELSVTFFG